MIGVTEDRRGRGLVFSFEDCVLDTDRRELRRGGLLQHVEPQVFDLLEHLVRHRARVVPREEFFDAVWRGRIVSDAALSTRIHAARRAIGDGGKAQRLIRTVHGRGLIFVGAAREDSGAALSLGNRRSDAPTVFVRRLAGDARDPRRAFIAEALTEEIAAALSEIGWISLAPCESADLRYIIQGSVRQYEDQLRAIVQIVDAQVGRCLWTGRFARPLGELFALQQQLAAEVKSAIGIQLYVAEALRAAAKSPQQINTWEAIVRALSLMNVRGKREVAAARSVLSKAVRSDPRSSQARSLLSFLVTLGVHMGWERREANIPFALHLARHAMLANPAEPWAYLALGYAMMYKNPDDAIPQLEQAIRLDPNLSIAHYIFALSATYAGDCATVFEHADTAARLSGFDLLARGNAGVYNNVRSTAYFVQEDFGRGIEFAREALAESPILVPAQRALMINLALAGKVQEARGALKRLKRLAPYTSLEWVKKTHFLWLRWVDRSKYLEAFRVAGLS